MAPILIQIHRSFNLPSISARSPTRYSPIRCSPRRISCQNLPPTVRTVTISYSDLRDREKDLSKKIEEGLGPNGLGIISISDIPQFPVFRTNLLYLAPRLANLPDDVKKELEDPDSRYSFGWSHGKEMIESGKLDTHKGSFYANPILDTPTTDVALMLRYPSYCRPNKWPTTSLPELEEAFKALGNLMFEVGLMLAHHCDQYVLKGKRMHENERLEQILKRSRCHKGRLLYYFPMQPSESRKDTGSLSSWCGWHTDFGSLTGLTCGLFTRNSVKIPCPDDAAGLYVQTRKNQVVKYIIPPNEPIIMVPMEVVADPDNITGYICNLLSFKKMNWLIKLVKQVKYYQEAVSAQLHIVYRPLMVRMLLAWSVLLLQCSCNLIGMRISGFLKKFIVTKS
ncbi:uncharacterized protein [Typha latifolia]|uniref:uncharacterized protein isoform X2 n=1 Tax=Typha latifolia TaxID=4733 RepID=UPI003C2FA626